MALDRQAQRGLATPCTTNTAAGQKRKRAVEVGARLTCRWRDGNYYEAEVLEVREQPDGSHSYYVHFLPFDRRLDEWVADDRLDVNGAHRVHAASPPSGEGIGPGAQRCRQAYPPSGPRPNLDTWRMQVEKKTRTPRKVAMEEDEKWDPCMLALEKQREEETRVKNFDRLLFGPWVMEPWYYSPFSERIMGHSRTVVVCEWCLQYMRKTSTLAKHQATCTARQPPGMRIYRQADVSVFEVDGAACQLYCQCLCLLAKLFLDHKTLYFDVAPFRFYVMTADDTEGSHVVGYFSKEKLSLEEHNLACILTLPPYQGQGYGHALIQFSYELSKREGKPGSPERPLSDLGRVGYFSYWKHTLLRLMWERREANVKQLSTLSGIACDDIVHVLSTLGFLTYYKGEHKASVSLTVLGECVSRLKQPKVVIDPQRISWAPPPPPTKRELMRARSTPDDPPVAPRLVADH
eukprot:GGOE01002896.1.p1 GENE.GGOE01002896.1~~GGOE01002896.1.p1  ORF type:complete len:462 (-),score=127.91 GGOE01002896.1:125-1510(-)